MASHPLSVLRRIAIPGTVLALAAAALAGCTPAEEQDPVATFEVAGQETYRVQLATPELVEHARALLEGEQVASIPVGEVVRDEPGVNEPWSWHIDPATLEFADVTIEVCDGLPSHVEDGTITSEQYCPWSAEIVSID